MEQIETTLPEGPGTYVVTSIIVDQGTNPGTFASAASSGVAGCRFAITISETEHSIIAEVSDGEVTCTKEDLENFAQRILGTGARLVMVHLGRTPDGQRNVIILIDQDSMGQKGKLEIYRYPTRREEAGGDPLTASQLRTRMGRPTMEPPARAPIHCPDEARMVGYGSALRQSLSRDLGIDLPSATATELVSDSATDGRVDIERLAGTLASEARIPVDVARVFVLGCERKTGAPVPELEAATKHAPGLAGISGKSGDLAANAGFQRLVLDVVEALRGEGAAASRGEAAHILVALHDATELMLRTAALMRDQRSDQFQFASAVKRATEAGNAHRLGDAYAQAPRHVARQVLGQIVGGMQASDVPTEGPVFETPIARTLADEPDFQTDQMWNYGPRWRRLDTPDHLAMARRLGVDLLAHAWIRTCDDTTDQEGRIFDPEGRLTLPGDDHDYSDVMWMIGVGPDADNIAPLWACFVGREFVRPGVMTWRHMPLQVENGPLADAAREALAIALHSQLLDDIEWQTGRHGHVTLTMTTSDPVPTSEDEAQKLLSYRFMSYALQSIAALNEEHGEIVTVLKDGESVNDRIRPPERMPGSARMGRYEAVEMHSVLGTDAWGGVGLIRSDGYINFLRVDKPKENKDLKIARRTRDEMIAEDCYDEFIEDAVMECIIRVEESGDEDRDLEAVLEHSGRIMLIADKEDGTSAVHFDAILPGMDVPTAMQALIARHRAGATPHLHVNMSIDEEFEDPIDFDNNDDIASRMEALLSIDYGPMADFASLTVAEADMLSAGASLSMAKGLCNPGNKRWWDADSTNVLEVAQQVTILHVDIEGSPTACQAALARMSTFGGVPIHMQNGMTQGVTARVDIDVKKTTLDFMTLVTQIIENDQVGMTAVAWSDDGILRLAHAIAGQEVRLYRLRD